MNEKTMPATEVYIFFNMAELRWVKNYWIDKMRSGNAPDLPDHITIDQFEYISKQIAISLESSKDFSHGS